MADPRSAHRKQFVANLTFVTLSNGSPESVSSVSDSVSSDSIVSTVSDSSRMTQQVKPKDPFTVLEDQSLRCSLCGKIYKQKGSMKSHLKKNHNIADAIEFQCETCNKQFDSKKKLTRHQNSKSDCSNSK